MAITSRAGLMCRYQSIYSLFHGRIPSMLDPTLCQPMLAHCMLSSILSLWMPFDDAHICDACNAQCMLHLLLPLLARLALMDVLLTMIHVEASHAFVLVLQGPLSLHCKGCAHCDVKPDNIRVRLAANGTLSCTLVDLGGSVDYSGELMKSGINRAHGSMVYMAESMLSNVSVMLA